MKIFFACHRLPFPPKRGGKIRPFNIISHLSEAGHDVTVATIARSENELDEGRPLKDYCEKVLVGRVGKVAAAAGMIARLPTPAPSSMGYFYSQALHREASAAFASTRFDLQIVHCSTAAQYASPDSSVPSLLDFGDMDSQKWLDYSAHRRFPLSLGYWLEGHKLQRKEKSLARQFAMSTCTTKAEMETLRSFDAARRLDWFPNGVDAEFFAPTDDPYDADQICFVGRMDYYPNQQAMLEFCANVLPRIQEDRPATRLVIVGAEPSPAILRLGDLPGVQVTGTVVDVRDYVRGSALTVAPLRIARGTQNKILESMAMGVPVVCSANAAGGVDAVDGEHLLTAGSDAECAQQVRKLLDNPEERRRLSVNARARALSNHSWPSSMQKFDGILASLFDDLSRSSSEGD